MKKYGVKVALNISKLSVPDLINRARFYVDAIGSNPQTFVSPNPTLVSVSSAIDDLEAAWNEAADGGKTKKAIMHNKESDLRMLLTDLGNYVQGVANGDPAIITLAAMAIKTPGIKHNPIFFLENGADRGDVRLQVKAAGTAKTLYRWQYRKDQDTAWQEGGLTGTAVTNIGPLDSGFKYWFRVFYVRPGGETLAYEPLSLVVI